MSAPVEDLLWALRKGGLDYRPDMKPDTWRADCSRCKPRFDIGMSLRISEPFRGGPVNVSCRNGCSREAVLGALDLDPSPRTPTRSSGSERATAALPAAGETTARALRPTLRRRNIVQLLGDGPPEVDWLIENLLARRAVTLLTGQHGAGKSLLGQATAAGIARGESVAGLACKRGKVVILDGENDEHELARRLHALGVKPGMVEYLEPDGFNLATNLPELEAHVGELGPDALILDTFRPLAAGIDENDAAKVDAVLRGLSPIARRFDCAVLLMHHIGKGDDDYRGSTAIGAVPEIGVKLAKRGEVFELSCWKNRLAPLPERRWFTIAPPESDRLALLPTEPPRRGSAKTTSSKVTELARRFSEISRERGALRWGELCAAVGVDPTSGTAKDARARLLKDGTLVRLDRGVYGPSEQAAGPMGGWSDGRGPLKGPTARPTIPTDAEGAAA